MRGDIDKSKHCDALGGQRVELVGRKAIAIPRVTLESQYFCQPSIAMLSSTLTSNTSWLDTGIVLEGSTKVLLMRLDKRIADLS